MQQLIALAPTLVGGLIGFLSARFMWRVQIQRQKRNIAQGLLLELSSLEKPLQGYANLFRNPPMKGFPKITTPLYPKHGLYFALQRDMVSFDAELSRALFRFYIGLLEAEQTRQHPSDDPAFPLLIEGVAKGLQSLAGQLPRLKVLLSGQLGRSERRIFLQSETEGA